MAWSGTRLGAVLFAGWLAFAPALAAPPRQESSISAEAQQLQQWVVRTRDNAHRAFAIVDKREARLHVFDARGRPVASTAALIGQAPGDDIAAGVGEHAQQGHVPFEERTTPAGRFATEAGTNLKGEHVVWLDYESAFAIHRLRPGASEQDRTQRIASTTAADRRASLGCVVVPVAFYVDVVQPLLGTNGSVVYVLPERGSWRELLARVSRQGTEQLAAEAP